MQKKKQNRRHLSIFVVLFICSLASANTNKKAAVIEPDNTRVNKRDKSVLELTADQHSTREADVSVTRSIRQNIMADSSLSTYAKNIKIITNLGHVTLKGPVENREEKRTLETIARKVAGDDAVNNQIDVLKPSRQGE